jgi:ribosomal protein L44E
MPQSIEHRPCPTCRRSTLHEATHVKNGIGQTLAEIADCLEHRRWADGRVEIRGPRTGAWIESGRSD